MHLLTALLNLHGYTTQKPPRTDAFDVISATPSM